MILGQEEKPSLDELAHHGVKGMKWGVRRNTKPTGREIRDARARQHSRATEINNTASRLNLATSSKQQQNLAKKYSEQSAAFLRSPDRATAMRMTKGEKAALVLLTVPTGAVAPVYGVGRYAVRKTIESQQRKMLTTK